MRDAFVSHRDLDQLVNRCIDVEDVRSAVLHGLSDGRFKRLDTSDAREMVGYTPQDASTKELPPLRGLHLRDTLMTHGGAADRQESGIRAEVG